MLKSKLMKALTLIVAVLAAAAYEGGMIPGLQAPQDAPETARRNQPHPGKAPQTQQVNSAEFSAELRRLIDSERSGQMVTTTAKVDRTLPDDNEGSRHQRFLIRDTNGQSVLIAHNIDLAPKVPLGRGDMVRIRGQYEWNEKGGVLHWTHHAPRKDHAEGWIDFNGKRYE